MWYKNTKYQKVAFFSSQLRLSLRENGDMRSRILQIFAQQMDAAVTAVMHHRNQILFVKDE
jgi:hypothetical protein